MIRHGWTDRAYLKLLTEIGLNLLIWDTICKKFSAGKPPDPHLPNTNPLQYPLGYAPAGWTKNRHCVTHILVVEFWKVFVLDLCFTETNGNVCQNRTEWWTHGNAIFLAVLWIVERECDLSCGSGKHFLEQIIWNVRQTDGLVVHVRQSRRLRSPSEVCW